MLRIRLIKIMNIYNPKCSETSKVLFYKYLGG